MPKGHWKPGSKRCRAWDLMRCMRKGPKRCYSLPNANPETSTYRQCQRKAVQAGYCHKHYMRIWSKLKRIKEAEEQSAKETQSTE